MANSDHIILCIDDEKDFLIQIKEMLAEYNVITATSISAGLSIMDKTDIDMIFLDINLDGENGLDGLKKFKSRNSSIDVVMVTGFSDPEYVVKAIKLGASDYVCKPFSAGEIVACVEKSKKSKEKLEKYEALLGELNSADIESRIIGKSRSLCALLETSKKLKGHHRANVLIEGESGTGKELLARYVHRLEEDPKRPFIAVNCAAIPENLAESEFFGHEKGAFTGAIQKKIGKLVLADKGDIFLDEISTLKPEMQAKLLRAIQEKEFCPVGSNVSIKSDFRVIAATNEKLEEMIRDGKFRLDLYHRLKVVGLKMPPLRERLEDIEDLVKHFVSRYAPTGKPIEITDDAIAKLKKYFWPGNIRELENIIHGSIILSHDGKIDECAVPLIFTSSDANPCSCAPKPVDIGGILPLKDFLLKAECEYLKEVLRLNDNDKDKVSDLLDVSRTTLYSKLKLHGLSN